MQTDSPCGQVAGLNSQNRGLRSRGGSDVLCAGVKRTPLDPTPWYSIWTRNPEICSCALCGFSCDLSFCPCKMRGFKQNRDFSQSILWFLVIHEQLDIRSELYMCELFSGTLHPLRPFRWEVIHWWPWVWCLLQMWVFFFFSSPYFHFNEQII